MTTKKMTRQEEHDFYADADDRSVSAWIRRAVDRELEHGTKTA